MASVCKESVQCSICRSECHSDLLHLTKEEKKKKGTKERESDGVPWDKEEIPTPKVAMQYPHLKSIDEG